MRRRPVAQPPAEAHTGSARPARRRGCRCSGHRERVASVSYSGRRARGLELADSFAQNRSVLRRLKPPTSKGRGYGPKNSALRALGFSGALGDLADFYEPMGMPIPNHNFMHFSWVGKTFAIGVLLIVGTFSRRFSLLLLALTIALIQQLSDLIIAQVLDVYVPDHHDRPRAVERVRGAVGCALLAYSTVNTRHGGVATGST